MKFLRIGEPGEERPVVLNDSGRAFDLSPLVADIDGDFFATETFLRARQALADGTLPDLGWELTADQLETRTPSGERIGAPIARPGNIICVGMNYAAHARESGAEPPKTPVVFLKPANTIAGPYDNAPIPPGAKKYDWEVELGIVIGKHASYLNSAEEATAVIAGYVAANDLSEREYQLPGEAGQWTKGKSLPYSTPVGPFLVPSSEVDGENLACRSWINGEIRQDSNTADFIFDIPTMVQHLSQYMLLEPGDLILTGTPEGVALSGRFPYITDGDVGEFEIDQLGRQRQSYYQLVTQ
ncbi:fumarylacetoacetate hydrolase family protein [Glutamicibacter sp. Je.9.36]|uniref:fumarylacetoacetate hydrolase family protein n=1 Tax=Glutamicibacter sp. Je.9.36 TaxID=3142837 RepID=UPI003DA86D05